jgi:hypothetical protein
MKLTRVVAALCLVLPTFASPKVAEAEMTICDLQSALKFGYGPKVSAIVWVARQDGDEFRASIESFFERSDYLVSSVGSGDPLDPSAYWDQLPQSPSLDIAFHIETHRDRAFALITLTTFSFDCRATEDWRPHWKRFSDHLRASEFRTYLAWRPLVPEVSQTVGGGFSTPIWFVRLHAAVEAFVSRFE